MSQVTCQKCDGGGLCLVCGGDGNDGINDCDACNGGGNCLACDGLGLVEESS